MFLLLDIYDSFSFSQFSILTISLFLPCPGCCPCTPLPASFCIIFSSLHCFQHSLSRLHCILFCILLRSLHFSHSSLVLLSLSFLGSVRYHSAVSLSVIFPLLLSIPIHSAVILPSPVALHSLSHVTWLRPTLPTLPLHLHSSMECKG